ncbi:hypothetical protein [Chitinophaga sp. CF418]|uniref:hypothetical protein n=1 Tax=Chitinophaga sp. CF418 TaxID=1855287 RepID=UPI00091E6CA4|nr:hypothetical protein [Chitinophaga sp. CF418]SHN08185.1 hypothetical protein SAMN05216311_10564 [Chitinophaga sp. CF418]
MFEKRFLAYVLYITLVEIREQAYEKGDNRLYWLSDILHTVPLSLLDDESSKAAYETLIKAVEKLEIEGWFKQRSEEFYKRYPEYLSEDK